MSAWDQAVTDPLPSDPNSAPSRDWWPYSSGLLDTWGQGCGLHFKATTSRQQWPPWPLEGFLSPQRYSMAAAPSTGHRKHPHQGTVQQRKGDKVKSKGGSRAEKMPEGHSWVTQEVTCRPIRKTEANRKSLQLLEGERQHKTELRGKGPRVNSLKVWILIGCVPLRQGISPFWVTSVSTSMQEERWPRGKKN